jgi:hypothetical protein
LTTPKNGSRHAALDMGCDTCHVTHKNTTRRMPGWRKRTSDSPSVAPTVCNATTRTSRRSPS